MELVLQAYGAHLKCKNNMFCIQTPEKQWQLPVQDVTSILLNKATLVSTDALLLALQHRIDVLLLHPSGAPAARLWNHSFGTTVATRQNQLLFVENHHGIAWATQLVAEKIGNQVTVLESLQAADVQHRTLTTTLRRLHILQKKVSDTAGSPSQILPTLRGCEGMAGKLYFTAVAKCLPSMYFFEKRSQHPAYDMFNACLNYTYGMLYAKVEAALIKAGLDPAIGILHVPHHNKPVLTFDVIERYRFWADYVVIQLCMQQVLHPSFFTVIHKNEWQLGADGKSIVVQCMNDYLNELIEEEGVSRSRLNHIERYAYQLAKLVNQAAQ